MINYQYANPIDISSIINSLYTSNYYFKMKVCRIRNPTIKTTRESESKRGSHGRSKPTARTILCLYTQLLDRSGSLWLEWELETIQIDFFIYYISEICHLTLSLILARDSIFSIRPWPG